jgi:hypothetical protein
VPGTLQGGSKSITSQNTISTSWQIANKKKQLNMKSSRNTSIEPKSGQNSARKVGGKKKIPTASDY